MSDDWSFKFSFPDIPDGKKVTPAEAEFLLLGRLEEKKREFEEAIWQLARYYGSTGRQDIAWRYIKHLMGMTDDPEEQASCWLALGQLMERIQDFEGAVDCYKQAYAMEPIASRTWYFINNNLGYSLIQIGRYEDAERYCRAAIEIDHARFNGHKNLGISLEGQGQYAQAAQCFIDSVKANSADPRAKDLLEKLVRAHPEVSDEMPNINELLDKCREAVRIGTGVRGSYVRKKLSVDDGVACADRILIAVARIVGLEGRDTFSSEDIRMQVGVTREEWMSGYIAIFQAMRQDEPGRAPQINEEYRGVFREIRHGRHTLTDHGYQLIRQLDHE